MGCNDSLIPCYRLRNISSFLVFFLILSSNQLRFRADGRSEPKPLAVAKTENEAKAIIRTQIGSRPPRCERRCSSCGHCEAIQVPTNPQAQNKIKDSPAILNVNYARGDDSSNYKPMSWKCKCGNLIFNP